MTKQYESSFYFDWQWWRFAWATGAYWARIPFKDAEYRRLVLGLYWRVGLDKGWM